jgi:hypothetical protein
MSKTIKAVFGAGDRTATCPQWQYDYNTRLEFVGLNLPEHFEVDFANSTTGQSQTVLGENNSVVIPAQYFIPGSTIFAWVYVVDGDSGYTRAQAVIPIATRATRTGEEPTPEQQSALDEAIAALNAAVEGVPETIDAALQEAKSSGEFDGADGAPGADGYSPTAVISSISGGHRLSITDANGTQTCDIMDGTNGGAPRIVHFTRDNNALTMVTSLDDFNAWIGDFEENNVPVMAMIDGEAMSLYPVCQSYNFVTGRNVVFYDARPNLSDLNNLTNTGQIRWISILRTWNGIQHIWNNATSLAALENLSPEIWMESGEVGEVGASEDDLAYLVANTPNGVMPSLPFYLDADNNEHDGATAIRWEDYNNGGVHELRLWLVVDMGDNEPVSTRYLAFRVSDGVILANEKISVNEQPSAADIGAIPAPSNPSSGQFLVYNGTAWAAQTVPNANGGAF